MFQIYGLIDPRTKELRYVGFSHNYLERFCEHLLPSQLCKNTQKNSWIKSVLNSGNKPLIIVIEEFLTLQEALEAEVENIAYFKFIGCNLTNGTLGGDGRYGFITSEEVKKKISKSMKGKNTKPKIKSNCLECQNEFEYYAKYLKRGHKFCSLVCANRHNNRLRSNTSVEIR